MSEQLKRIDRALARLDTAKADAPARAKFVFRSVSEVLANPTRPSWLIKDILEENVMALMAGPRGTYKSFIAMHWAMLIAISGQPVCIISAEGAGIDRRIRAWLLKHAPSVDPATLRIQILERRVNFNDLAQVQEVKDALAELEFAPKLVVIDTVSKNSGGMEENDNSEVKVFIGIIDDHIRRAYQATVLLLHHTGHEAQGRARGASAFEADTDAAYIIKRDPGTRIVSVSRERFKDSADLEPLVYQAEIIELGDRDEFDQPVTSIALVPATAEVVSARAESQPRGARQKELLRVLKRLAEEAGTELIWTSADLARIGRDAGMARATARDAAAGLTGFYLVSTVGGYRLKRPGE